MVRIGKFIAVVILGASLAAGGCDRKTAADTGLAEKPAITDLHDPQLVTRANGLFDVVRLKPNSIITVGKIGENAAILKSDDGGKTWKPVNSPSPGILFSVNFMDDQHGVIVGENGLYMESSDGGKNWKARSIGQEQNLFVVRFVSPTNGYIVGAFGTVLQTADGGKTWKSIVLDWEHLMPALSQEFGTVQPHLYAVAFSDPQHIWIGGEYGVIVATEDGGKTWKIQAGGSMGDRHVFSLASVTPGKLVAVGQGGEILYTADSGAHWAVAVAPTTDVDLYGLAENASNGEVLAVGDLGSAYLSTEGGSPGSWHPLTIDRGSGAPLSVTWLTVALFDSGEDVLGFGELGVWRIDLKTAAEQPQS